MVIEDGERSLPGVSGRTVDLEVEVEPLHPEKGYSRFAIRFAKNDNFHSGVSFRPHESTLKIDRKFSGSRRAIIHQRRAHVHHDNGRLKLRVILDRFSAEIFVNDGEKVMSMAISTELNADAITFFADGGVRLRVRKYTLEA